MGAAGDRTAGHLTGTPARQQIAATTTQISTATALFSMRETTHTAPVPGGPCRRAVPVAAAALPRCSSRPQDRPHRLERLGGQRYHRGESGLVRRRPDDEIWPDSREFLRTRSTVGLTVVYRSLDHRPIAPPSVWRDDSAAPSANASEKFGAFQKTCSSGDHRGWAPIVHAQTPASVRADRGADHGGLNVDSLGTVAGDQF